LEALSSRVRLGVCEDRRGAGDAKLLASKRKQKLTVSKTEDKLAAELSRKKVPFQRQFRIGKYVVDFLVPPSIVVDVEGPHHNRVPQAWRDEKRRAYLVRRSYRLYEFSAAEVYASPWKYAELLAAELKRLKQEKTV
jgi:very-short-patch-repair endonuclease